VGTTFLGDGGIDLNALAPVRPVPEGGNRPAGDAGDGMLGCTPACAPSFVIIMAAGLDHAKKTTKIELVRSVRNAESKPKS
jgi:hypothetical protein